MLTAEFQFLSLFLVYFILNIMICFTSRPNDAAQGPIVCVREHWKGVGTLPLPRAGLDFFIIHVSCSLFVLYLGEAEEQAGPWSIFIATCGKESWQSLSYQREHKEICAKIEEIHISASSGLFMVNLYVPENGE